MIQDSKIFHVVIEKCNVDNHKASDYTAFTTDSKYNTTGGTVVTTEKMKAKAKALVRFQNVARAVQKGLDCMYDITTTGDNPETVATQITFSLLYTQPVFYNTGTTILSDEDAVKKMIEDVLSTSYQEIVPYYEMNANPGGTSGKGTPSGAPCGWTYEKMTIEPISLSSTCKVTVTPGDVIKTEYTF